MKNIFILSVMVVLTVALVCACGPKVKKSDRWDAYEGCGEAQCQSWFEQCSTECMNGGEMGVTECENKCYSIKTKCLVDCPGR